jgi:hypothetical protein
MTRLIFDIPEKAPYPNQYPGIDNNGMSAYPTGNNYPVDETYSPDSPFFPFSGSRRLAGPPQVSGNCKRKKEVRFSFSRHFSLFL